MSNKYMGAPAESIGEAMGKQLQKERQDAARYRWLRSGVNHNASWIVGTYAQEDLDAQIDIAMKEEK